MRTPEEIKKGLECCASLDEKECEVCPYKPDRVCGETKNGDALAYILQLERERDAAVNNLHGMCGACIRHNNDDDEIYVCSKYVECVHGIGDDEGEDYWQWRGVREVE